MSAILACNAGSSNVKLALFDADSLTCLHRLHAESKADTLTKLCALGELSITAIGHRVVHGGRKFIEPQRITPSFLKELRTLAPLAPLHELAAISLMETAHRLYPDVPQTACFDTAFHHTMPQLERMLPLPRHYAEEGIERYGFHGLSYQYIASVLPEEIADGRVIVAHLGNGSSMCAMRARESIASSMGFSTLDGLMMGTRCGALDPGVLLHLLQQKKMSADEIADLLYHKAGLKGVSGLSADMRTLLTSNDKHAAEAVTLYCYLAAKQLGGLLMALGGLDALVFTGGIGEHAAPVRQQICDYLQWLGVKLESASNLANACAVSGNESVIPVYVIPTDEEAVIARACIRS